MNKITKTLVISMTIAVSSALFAMSPEGQKLPIFSSSTKSTDKQMPTTITTNTNNVILQGVSPFVFADNQVRVTATSFNALTQLMPQYFPVVTSVQCNAIRNFVNLQQEIALYSSLPPSPWLRDRIAYLSYVLSCTINQLQTQSIATTTHLLEHFAVRQQQITVHGDHESDVEHNCVVRKRKKRIIVHDDDDHESDVEHDQFTKR